MSRGGGHFNPLWSIGVLIRLRDRVPTAEGKQGKWRTKFSVKENTGNLEILPKHRELFLLKFVF